MVTFSRDLTLEEINKLTPEEMKAYIEYNDNKTGFTKEYEEGRGDQSDIYKEVDPEYLKEANAYAEELKVRAEASKTDLEREVDRLYKAKEAETGDYVVKATAQAKAEDEKLEPSMVKDGMSKLMDYAALQDKQISAQSSEVAGLKKEVSEMRAELQQAKQLEKERLQKEMQQKHTDGRYYISKEVADKVDADGRPVIPWFEK